MSSGENLVGDDFDYYVLEKRKERKGGIATAALRCCGLCGVMISGMGGPGYGSVCKRCGDLLKSQKMTGCVDWSEVDSDSAEG